MVKLIEPYHALLTIYKVLLDHLAILGIYKPFNPSRLVYPASTSYNPSVIVNDTLFVSMNAYNIGGFIIFFDDKIRPPMILRRRR